MKTKQKRKNLNSSMFPISDGLLGIQSIVSHIEVNNLEKKEKKKKKIGTVP